MIASYLLAGDEPALVDCGPTTCLGALEEGLAGQGLAAEDLRHLILTHIHLDHAGAAGALVRRNPELQVHVSEIGAPHLVDPSRLEASARRLYADDFDRLWGELVRSRRRTSTSSAAKCSGSRRGRRPGTRHTTFPTSRRTARATRRRHRRRHRALDPHSACLPAARRRPRGLGALARLGRRTEARAPLSPALRSRKEPAGHIARTRERLRTWAGRVRDGASEEEFVRAAEQELETATDPETAASYTQAGPLWQSHAGLVRYFAKKGEAAAGRAATL